MANKTPDPAKSANSTPAYLFKPGASGNPSGRPKINKRIRELAREHTEEAMEAIIAALKATKTVGWGENMTEAIDHAVRLSAANVILDRGWGKSVSETDMPRDDDAVSDLANMNDEQLLKLALGSN